MQQAIKMSILDRLALRLDGYRSPEEYWQENTSGRSWRDARDLVVLLFIIACPIGYFLFGFFVKL